MMTMTTMAMAPTHKFGEDEDDDNDREVDDDDNMHTYPQELTWKMINDNVHNVLVDTRHYR